MKIKIKDISYDELIKLKRPAHRRPRKPNVALQKVVNLLATSELNKAHFKEERIDMDRLPKNEPCLILMNHSSFIDLEIASKVLYPRPYQIVCTTDGFIGKEMLMRHLGCIPTQKFVIDLNLLKDMAYALRKLKTSVLMYPEAGYSFDGTATTLPESLGKCIKKLKVPVVMINTYGAFT
ncbi:MAG: 1-acyl-sn-glycerol-3-phosphate acyltransferase, partial [Lachnospiraceae bacterium]|nr:1-acyl-sn-glycerol-3-phosphate acyltransferase [Lachnospiraceae bacterium]